MANVLQAHNTVDGTSLVNVPVVVWSSSGTSHGGPSTLAELGLNPSPRLPPLTEATLM